MNYLIFVLGYDLLQSQLNMYDIPCDVAFEYCTNLYSTYSDSPESEQDKSEYECLQDYVDNHMHEIESEIIELAKKYSEYKEEENVMIKNATFTSVWNGGYEVTTNCKVDMETREVFDIEINDSNNIEMLNELDYEYITIDGKDFDVFSIDEVEDANFWYE